MPAVLERSNFDAWLKDGATELLVPAADGVLQRWPVSKRVNSSRALDDDSTLEPSQGPLYNLNKTRWQRMRKI
jgi:putative SOS response-associated peptidase YedK